MPVNGLLLTLTTDPALATATRQTVSSRAGTELGDSCDRWQPVAVETPGVKEAHDFHEWLESLPGVEQVDVIYVGFDEPSLTETAP